MPEQKEEPAFTMKIVLCAGPLDGKTLDAIPLEKDTVLYRRAGRLYLYKSTGTVTGKGGRVRYTFVGQVAQTATLLFIKLYGAPQGEQPKDEKEGPL